MLVSYTPIAVLSEGERQKLFNTLPHMVLDGRTYIDIGGKYISCAELRPVKESMVKQKNRTILFE